MKIPTILAISLAAVLVSSLLLVGPVSIGSIFPANHNNHVQEAEAQVLPLIVRDKFKEKQLAGDAEGGSEFLDVNEEFIDPENHCEFCTKVEYVPGPEGAAGFSYEDLRGLDLSNAKKVRFWVMGEEGNEKIKFKLAGKSLDKIQDRLGRLQDRLDRLESGPAGIFESWWSANMEADPVGAKQTPPVVRALAHEHDFAVLEIETGRVEGSDGQFSATGRIDEIIDLEAIGAEGTEVSVPARGSVRTVLRDVKAPKLSCGVVASRAVDAEPIFACEAETPLIPASNQKILSCGAAVLLLGQLEDHAVLSKVQPGVDVGRKIGGSDQRRLPRAPAQPLGHRGQAGRGIGDEGDLRRGGADQLGRPLAHPGQAMLPAAVIETPAGGAFGQKTGDGLDHRLRRGRNGGMVEKGVLPGDRKLLAAGGVVHGISP